MPFEFHVKNIFQDLNPCKCFIYICLFCFCILFSLRLDEYIKWNYFVVFIPLWIWKFVVLVAFFVGVVSWIRHPLQHSDRDSLIQFKALLITISLTVMLLLFEFLLCDKLQYNRPYILWVMIFVPLFCMSTLCIGLCIWALRNARTIELEVFISVNILQFIFLALKFDEFIPWRWVIIFIPSWILICVALIIIIYAVVLGIILMRSRDIAPDHRRAHLQSTIGYTFMLLFLSIFMILLRCKLDGLMDISFSVVNLPLYFAFFILLLMACCTKAINIWWFGIRKDFCPWLLSKLPMLQEYGNISYNNVANNTNESLATESTRKLTSKSTNVENDALSDSLSPTVLLDMPD